MPSLTQPFSKKRRRDDHDTNGEIHLAFPQQFHHSELLYQQQHHGAPSKRIISISSPLAKKIRMSTEFSSTEDAKQSQRQTPLVPSSRHNHTRTPSATKSPCKSTTSTNLLSPCHICHRKPTKKNELDLYADCEGCGERTCYVCIRECLGWKHVEHEEEILMQDQEGEETRGWKQMGSDNLFNMEDAPPTEGENRFNAAEDKYEDQDHTNKGGTWGNGVGGGHRMKICSQCCVEDGPEGEVICLGCLGR